eukprot:COSAG01_NODE_1125_length_11596_cov_8.205532_2_plen_542_part_00
MEAASNATAALQRAMSGVERARATFEAETQRVSNELAALQEAVMDANLLVTRGRTIIEGERRKRRRLSGEAALPQQLARGEETFPGAPDEAAFEAAADAVQEQLQSHRRTLARTHYETQLLQAKVGAALASAAPLCMVGRLAAVQEARNAECSALVRLLGGVAVQGGTHAAVLGLLSVVDLWRVRRVCRAFRRWCAAELSSMPRPVAVGGTYVRRPATPAGVWAPTLSGSTAGVEALDLSTMRWSSTACAVPPLPQSRAKLAMCAKDGGRIVVVGGYGHENSGQRENQLRKTALRWVPGASSWAPLPDVDVELKGPTAAALPDGRVMVVAKPIGSSSGHLEARILAADGSSWTSLAADTSIADVRPLVADSPAARRNAAVAVLPCCKQVLVAGGKAYTGEVLKTACLWDPATQAWTALPDMHCARYGAGCCVLPSGRVAVVGGCHGQSGNDAHNHHRSVEFLDLRAAGAARAWQLLPLMADKRVFPGVVSVAGGMLVVGWPSAALYDEDQERWFQLPHQMVEPRAHTAVVSLASDVITTMP